MQIFEQILLDHGAHKRIEMPKIVTAEIEKAVGFILPDDYKTHLQTFQSFEGFIGKEYVYLAAIEELIELNTGYRIFETLPNTLNIGGNRGGSYIAIEKTSTDSFKIVLGEYIGMNKEDHIDIGDSFSEFLIRLDDGREWFE